jgi:glucan 1,3-beta-glucosidase
MAVIDADPYTNTGVNWYTNTNNFFRSIRNFVIDLTAMPQSSGAGIHWQVAQASSLQNIRFEMVKGGGDANQQQGVFMDNGSGGFMTDLVFNGGNYGMFLGNQQFTTRNVTFNDCNTAIFMNWDWAWTFKSVTVNNCAVGLNMSNSPTNQTVGSVLLIDSKISATSKGIITAFTNNSAPIGAGTLVLKNVDFTGSSVAVAGIGGNTILPGGSVVPSFVQGNTYTPAGGAVKRSSVSAGVLAPRQADVCAEGQMTTITIVTTLGVPTVGVPEAPIPAVSASTGSAPVISVSELVSASSAPAPTQTTAASLSVSPSTAMTSALHQSEFLFLFLCLRLPVWRFLRFRPHLVCFPVPMRLAAQTHPQ